MSGTLYLVPTPIGNLEDITLRALRVLKEVSVVLAEDTRTSRRLLEHYGITTPLRAFHAHNEHAVVERVVDDLSAGAVMALVTPISMAAPSPAITNRSLFLGRSTPLKRSRYARRRGCPT